MQQTPISSAQVEPSSNRHIIVAVVLILVLGGLGAFSWVGNLTASAHYPIVTTLIQGSECTATPKTITYQPPPPTNQAKPTLSTAWSINNRSQQDYSDAQACAAAFIASYETFTSTDLKTLQNCTSMLTNGAKKRFTGTAPDSQPDQHMNPMWQASVQKQAYQQTARTAEPTLINAIDNHGQLLVWMLVNYHTTIQSGNTTTLEQDAQMTVLLVGVFTNQDHTGTGWQVSQWVAGKTQQPVPEPL